MSARYFYLQLDLIGSKAEPLSLRQTLQAACGEVFGECGSVLPLDILTVQDTETGGVALVRVPAQHLVRARAALVLAAPALRVARQAASLQALVMSISRLESGPGGKDVVLVASASLLAEPSRVSLPDPAPAPGLILADGSINWGCPCLGGMATGPCAQPFRDAFSCFHYSEAEPKGSDCYEKFSEMQTCMAGYPELYGRDDDGDADGDEPAMLAPMPDHTESGPDHTESGPDRTLAAPDRAKP